MKPGMIIFLVILAVLVIAFVVLYFVGKKAQKKQAEQQEMLQANKQTVSMLIIDKKRMKIKDSGLPQMVIDQTPKLMRNSKLPIIKAKVGPQVMSLISDEKIFDNVPVKKEVKAVVSGIYVLDVKGLHGRKEAAPAKKNLENFLASFVVSGISRNFSSMRCHSSLEYTNKHPSRPLVTTNSLPSCSLNLEGTISRPFWSIEWLYSPMNMTRTSSFPV